MTYSDKLGGSWSPTLANFARRDLRTGDAAGSLAAAGVPVFPCVPGEKQPLTPRGFHDATTSLLVAREWWRRTPVANIGMPTGTASGVAVVDVDVHGPETGYPAFARSGNLGLTNDWSALVRTPSGGLHAYFPVGRDGTEQRCWQSPRTHIDFRGDGGYVVVPPSRVMVDGVLKSYELIAVAQHEPRPLEVHRLRHLFDPPRPPPSPSDVPAAGTRPERLAAWMASRPEGARNHGLFWAACRMVEDGHPLTSTLTLLGDAACRAGLPEQEVERTIRSAHRIATRLSPRPSSSPTTPAPAVNL
jgi:hypothetical protein